MPIQSPQPSEEKGPALQLEGDSYFGFYLPLSSRPHTPKTDRIRAPELATKLLYLMASSQEPGPVWSSKQTSFQATR